MHNCAQEISHKKGTIESKYAKIIEKANANTHYVNLIQIITTSYNGRLLYGD
jgi:hypothetical protein